MKINIKSFVAAITLGVAGATHCEPCGPVDTKQSTTPSVQTSVSVNGTNHARRANAADVKDPENERVDEIILLQHPVNLKYKIKKTCDKTAIKPGVKATTISDAYSLKISLYVNDLLVACNIVKGSTEFLFHHVDNKFYCSLEALENEDCKNEDCKNELSYDLSERPILPCNSGTFNLISELDKKPKLRDLGVVKVASDEQGRSTYEVSYFITIDLRTCIEIDSDNNAINLKCDDVYNRYNILGCAKIPIKHRFQTTASEK